VPHRRAHAELLLPAPRPASLARDPLDARADSLIERLLATPGKIESDGHVYSFVTDPEVLEDLVALELHAVPQLIECMADSTDSKVTYHGGGVTGERPVLRGAVCFLALIHTGFFQMHDDELLMRVEVALDCSGFAYNGKHACGADYTAGGETLRRTQTVWRNYLAAYRSEHRPALPRLRQTAVGCYILRLQPRAPVPGGLDTARVHYFELDSLPLPGTVRPTRIDLSGKLAVGGKTSWQPHFESVIYVRWLSEKGQAGDPGLSVGFGGSDTIQTGYALYPRGGGPPSLGKPVVTRVSCRSRPAR
jgi:hypothetical protein